VQTAISTDVACDV